MNRQNEKKKCNVNRLHGSIAPKIHLEVQTEERLSILPLGSYIYFFLSQLKAFFTKLNSLVKSKGGERRQQRPIKIASWPLAHALLLGEEEDDKDGFYREKQTFTPRTCGVIFVRLESKDYTNCWVRDSELVFFRGAAVIERFLLNSGSFCPWPGAYSFRR